MRCPANLSEGHRYRSLHRRFVNGVPTGKTVEINGVNIDRVVNGRIAEHGGLADLLGPLLAMGAIQWVAPENPFGKR
jgi:hypothetical protein